MGLAAVEPPQSTVGHDDPVSGALVERAHDASTGILLRRVGVAQVRAVQPAVPGVDERGRQGSGGRAAYRPGVKEIVRLGLVRLAGPVDGGLVAELLEEWFEQLGAKRVL